MGLYFHYGFLYYFLPLLIYLLYRYSKNKTEINKKFLISYVYSCLGFLYGFSILVQNFDMGLKGIEWIAPYTGMTFVIPFLFGLFNWNTMTIIFITLFVIELLTFLYIILKDNVFIVVLICTLVSFPFAKIFTLIYRPLLHVRSLQVVGLFIFYSLAFVTYKLFKYNRMTRIISLMMVIVLLINFISILNRLPQNPGPFLIRFSQY